jgi:hypothetical protein
MTQLQMSEFVNQKKAALIKWAIIGACCVVAAPAALMVLKGVVALAVAGVVGAGSIFFAPVVAQRMAIQRVKMEVRSAEENPIETLQNEYVQMQKDAESFEKEVTAFAAEVDSFAQQTQEYKKEYPDDAKLFEDQLTAMRTLQTYKEGKFKQAQADLHTFDGVVKRAKAMWKMALSAKRMNEIAGRQSVDVFSQIRKDTSLDTVRQATYQSFAEVRTALLKKVDMPGAGGQAKLAAPQPPQTLGLVGDIAQKQPNVNQ